LAQLLQLLLLVGMLPLAQLLQLVPLVRLLQLLQLLLSVLSVPLVLQEQQGDMKNNLMDMLLEHIHNKDDYDVYAYKFSIIENII